MHDTIYKIRKQVVYKQWYWNKYGEHFFDLYIPQLKALMDVSLGLNVFEDGFINDAREIFVIKYEYLIKNYYTMKYSALRHHTGLDSGIYILISVEGVPQFKLILLNTRSHVNINDASESGAFFYAEMVNARMLHLYELSKRPKAVGGIILEDFRSKYVSINSRDFTSWEEYADKTLNDWIDRWKNRDEFYVDHYPNFYDELYKNLEEDLELFKNEDPACEKPEFWYFFLSEYFNKELLKAMN